MEQVDIKKWKVIYPIYLNKNFSRDKRRITTIENSCSDPTLKEICQILEHLKIPFVPENKTHPADFFNRGRVKYNLEQNGELIDKDIRNKKQLCSKLGPLISKLSSRQKKANNKKRKGKKNK